MEIFQQSGAVLYKSYAALDHERETGENKGFKAGENHSGQ